MTLDALVVKCREGGRTVNVCIVHAVGVNKDGFRESLGLDVVTCDEKHENDVITVAPVWNVVSKSLSTVKTLPLIATIM